MRGGAAKSSTCLFSATKRWGSHAVESAKGARYPHPYLLLCPPTPPWWATPAALRRSSVVIHRCSTCRGCSARRATYTKHCSSNFRSCNSKGKRRGNLVDRNGAYTSSRRRRRKKKRGGTHGPESNLKRKERPAFFFFETMHIKGMKRAQPFPPLTFELWSHGSEIELKHWKKGSFFFTTKIKLFTSFFFPPFGQHHLHYGWRFYFFFFLNLNTQSTFFCFAWTTT